MSQRILVPETYEPPSSSWRLINLALGLAAVLSFAGAMGGSSLLVPSRWILAPWFSSSSMETVPDAIKFITRIGINLWLPASAFLIFFALFGLHRKLAAPRSKFAAIALACSWAAHVALTAATFVLDAKFGGSDAAGAVGLIVGLLVLPIYAVLGSLAIIAAVSEISAMWRFNEPTHARVPISLLAWAIIPPLLSVVPLLLAPSNPLALATEERTEFETLCSTAGVRLMAKPAGPVRSIAYDWDPKRYSRRHSHSEYSLDKKGRMNSLGVDPSSYRVLSAKKLLHLLDFSESRQDDYCHARSEPRTLYAHCPSVRSNIELKAPYYGIDTFTADVLVYFDVNTADYMSHTNNHGPVRFEITLTDRRSGELLGEMSYVVDLANRRACGANVGTIISHEAFLYDAINR